MPKKKLIVDPFAKADSKKKEGLLPGDDISPQASSKKSKKTKVRKPAEQSPNILTTSKQDHSEILSLKTEFQDLKNEWCSFSKELKQDTEHVATLEQSIANFVTKDSIDALFVSTETFDTVSERWTNRLNNIEIHQKEGLQAIQMKIDNLDIPIQGTQSNAGNDQNAIERKLEQLDKDTQEKWQQLQSQLDTKPLAHEMKALSQECNDLKEKIERVESRIEANNPEQGNIESKVEQLRKDTQEKWRQLQNQFDTKPLAHEIEKLSQECNDLKDKTKRFEDLLTVAQSEQNTKDAPPASSQEKVQKTWADLNERLKQLEYIQKQKTEDHLPIHSEPPPPTAQQLYHLEMKQIYQQTSLRVLLTAGITFLLAGMFLWIPAFLPSQKSTQVLLYLISIPITAIGSCLFYALENQRAELLQWFQTYQPKTKLLYETLFPQIRIFVYSSLAIVLIAEVLMFFSRLIA